MGSEPVINDRNFKLWNVSQTNDSKLQFRIEHDEQCDLIEAYIFLSFITVEEEPDIYEVYPNNADIIHRATGALEMFPVEMSHVTIPEAVWDEPVDALPDVDVFKEQVSTMFHSDIMSKLQIVLHGRKYDDGFNDVLSLSDEFKDIPAPFEIVSHLSEGDVEVFQRMTLTISAPLKGGREEVGMTYKIMCVKNELLRLPDNFSDPTFDFMNQSIDSTYACGSIWSWTPTTTPINEVFHQMISKNESVIRSLIKLIKEKIRLYEEDKKNAPEVLAEKERQREMFLQLYLGYFPRE